MSDEQANFIECAVCGRNILRGERVSDYMTPERERVAVCALCKTRAEQMGWTPASLAATPATTAPQRRRGFDLRGRLSGRLSRRGGGMTADELAREIGIPDRPGTRSGPAGDQRFAEEELYESEEAGALDDLDDREELGESERERFPGPPHDEDDETRFPEPVTPAGQGRGGARRDPPRFAEGRSEGDPDEGAAEHGMAEPETFWDESAKPAPDQPPELRGEPEPDDEDESTERAPAREPRPPQSRRRSSRTSRRSAERSVSPPTPQPSAEPPRREPRTPARLMRTAAENFNASDESRKVGGLMRSLGEPSVSLRPPAREDLPALITVAWELSWYQWEVGVEADDSSVREIAKGSELDELDDAARRWNARADEDGMIRLRRAERGEDGGGSE